MGIISSKLGGSRREDVDFVTPDEGAVSQAALGLFGEASTSLEDPHNPGIAGRANGERLPEQADVVLTNSSTNEPLVPIAQEKLEAAAASASPAEDPMPVSKVLIEPADVEMAEADVIGPEAPPEVMNLDEPPTFVNSTPQAPTVNVLNNSVDLGRYSSKRSLDEGSASRVVNNSASAGEGGSVRQTVIHRPGRTPGTVADKDTPVHIRIDMASGFGSVIDCLRTGDSSESGRLKASSTWTNIRKYHTALADMTVMRKINNWGCDTPTAPPSVLVEIACVSLSWRPANDRREALAKLCETLGVEDILIDTLEQKYMFSVPKCLDSSIELEHVGKRQRTDAEEQVEKRGSIDNIGSITDSEPSMLIDKSAEVGSKCDSEIVDRPIELEHVSKRQRTDAGEQVEVNEGSTNGFSCPIEKHIVSNAEEEVEERGNIANIGNSNITDSESPIRAQIGSILDTLKYVDPIHFVAGDPDGKRWQKIRKFHSHFDTKVTYTTFGKVAYTKFGFPETVPCASYDTLIEIGMCWLYLEQQTAKQRREIISRLCNLLGVDVSIIDRLEKARVVPRLSNGSGR